MNAKTSNIQWILNEFTARQKDTPFVAGNRLREIAASAQVELAALVAVAELQTEFKTQSGKYRSVDGRRIGKESRGVWHVQDARDPSKSAFTGTLREIEAALHGRAVKMN